MAKKTFKDITVGTVFRTTMDVGNVYVKCSDKTALLLIDKGSTVVYEISALNEKRFKPVQPILLSHVKIVDEDHT